MAKQNRFFNLSTNRQDPPPQEDPHRHFTSKFLLAHFENVNHLEKNLTRLPSEEEFFFLQTGSSFNAFSFIPFVCKQKSVRRLYASTYSISRRVIEALIELHEKGLVEEITLLISDSMIKRNPLTIDVLTSVAKEYGNLNVLFGWNHSKVCLLETKEDHFVIEGSGNWANNAQMEQYTFANCEGLFSFRKELFEMDRVRQVAENGGIKSLTTE